MNVSSNNVCESAVLLADFSDLPPKPPRSKLEPHRELIRELRRKGRTYREVSRLFAERLGLRVAPSTLHSFVKVRARHRKQVQFELPAVELPAAQPPVSDRLVFRENEPLTLALMEVPDDTRSKDSSHASEARGLHHGR